MPCPNCNSNDWKMASVIYAEGLSGISTSTVGLGVGAGGLGAGVASTKGNQQSKLSTFAAPPVLKIHDGGFQIAIGLATLGFIAITSPESVGLITFLVALGLILIVNGITEISQKKPAEEKYKKELTEYKSKKMCLRCGTFFFGDCENLSPSVVATLIIVESLNSSDMKKCPFCAEEVRADAIRCKHCRSDI